MYFLEFVLFNKIKIKNMLIEQFSSIKYNMDLHYCAKILGTFKENVVQGLSILQNTMWRFAHCLILLNSILNSHKVFFIILAHIVRKKCILRSKLAKLQAFVHKTMEQKYNKKCIFFFSNEDF